MRPMPAIRSWLVRRLLAGEVDARVRHTLASTPAEGGPFRPLDDRQSPARPWHEVRALLERCSRVSRTNPLAARLMSMTTDFVIGEGPEVAGDPWALRFWHDPLNRLHQRLYRWCDELTRSGELFVVLSRNPVSRTSYVREVPAVRIDRIETDPDDLERELRYHQLDDTLEGRWWPGREDDDADQIMLHYVINRPIGQVRGLSDLATILTWLEHYDLWLEDRVRINRYKGAYLWHVRIENALPGQLEAKRAQYSRIPSSGSIIVTDGNETWQAVQPQIGADDVESDGKAMRLMIAAGAGVPLHFFAEGESANRATAREMGVATYRRFAHRQYVLRSMVEDVVRVAARRAGLAEVAFSLRLPPVHPKVEREGAS